ncbi:MAG: hypothetical protein C4335_08265 [Armatimonadota bacterium]
MRCPWGWLVGARQSPRASGGYSACTRCTGTHSLAAARPLPRTQSDTGFRFDNGQASAAAETQWLKAHGLTEADLPQGHWRNLLEAKVLGYWREDCPVRTDHPDVLATVYRKQGQSLIALASWAKEDAQVRLRMNGNVLGIHPKRCRMIAPPIPYVQPYARFAPNEPVPVPAGKGWLLLIEHAKE